MGPRRDYQRIVPKKRGQKTNAQHKGYVRLKTSGPGGISPQWTKKTCLISV